jgi:hypothetical protein
MVNRLIDPPLATYLLLGIVAIILFAAWRRTRKRGYLIALVINVALALLLGLVDYSFESDREQVLRKTAEAARAIEARNLDAFFRDVSEQFRYQNSDKAKFRSVVHQHFSAGQPQSFKIWSVEIKQFPGQNGTPPDEMMVQFYLKGSGTINGMTGEPQFTCKATFVRDPDKEWRLKTFHLFPLLGDSSTEFMVPGL